MDRGQAGESYFLHIHHHSQGHHDHDLHTIMIFSQWSVVAKLREVHQVQSLGKKLIFGVVVGQVQSFVCGSFAKIISRDLFWARTRIHSLSKVFITWYYRHTNGGGHIAYNNKLWNLMLFVILLTCLYIVYLSFLRVEFLCSL